MSPESYLRHRETYDRLAQVYEFLSKQLDTALKYKNEDEVRRLRRELNAVDEMLTVVSERLSEIIEAYCEGSWIRAMPDDEDE